MSRPAIIALASALLLATSSAAQEPVREELDAVAALLKEDRLAQAESELRRILARSDNAAARDLLGLALTRQGRLEEAEQEFSRASLLAPETLPPRQHLGRLYVQQERSEDALSELRAAARLGPLERDLALWLAEAELARGGDAPAEEQLLSVAERFSSVRALLELARLYARRGDSQTAAATVQRALELAPNSEEVLLARARVSLSVQAPLLAIRALESLTRMHPTVADHNYLLGVARLQIDDTAGAIAALQRALELAPARPLPLIALGTTLIAQKSFAEAAAVLRRALRLDPDSAEALGVLSEAEEGLGELQGAEEHATQALVREPEQARALETLGRIRMSQERYDEARDYFLRAVASAPRAPRTHYQLSLAFARLGDRQRSGEHLELYRQLRKERDERLVELRTQAGLGNSGMGR